ncbi:hypothetical protein [Candidatus Cyanaurora vandensis]|uniref:hypothetical protein n=1 Tax=Candidatus Cyanaurora vandensis TaxID=2714958 RepID=UPI00258115B9|nr:hypothetical protein [Candidatus Cyanaurora vandensis]
MQPPEGPRESLTSPRWSFGLEVRRGWDWIQFVWQMLRRIGGPGAILRTLWFVLTLLWQRTLTQWFKPK